MEHLFLNLDEATIASKVAEAANCDILNEADINFKASLIPPVYPHTEWMGFDHDGSSEAIPMGDDLAGYPSARGWTMDRVWDTGDLRQAHSTFQDPNVPGSDVAKQLVAMLQSWLYFGFLEAIIGKRIHTSYLLRVDSQGVSYVHSGYLGFALWAWVLSVKEASFERVSEDRWKSIRTVVTVVQMLYMLIDPDEATRKRLDEDFPAFATMVEKMLPSVIRLFDAISLARDRIAPEDRRRMVVLSGPPPVTASREQRLRERGWCPFLLAFCRFGLHESCLDWLDGTQREPPSVSGNHAACTETECVRNNIDPETYATLHTDSNCSCPFIAPDHSRVLSIIDQGMIPIMKLNGKALKVEAHHPGERGDYFAISHVWVDGLGSEAETGLPLCQVERFSGQVHAASDCPETLFWIDSLCIPKAEEQRRLSIARLRDVYQNAAGVLVVDQTILNCVLDKDTPIEDLLWAITSSAWAQRLWTYQECYLADEVHFAIAGGKFVTWKRDFEASRNIPTLRILYASFEQHLRHLRPRLGPEDASIAQENRAATIAEVATALNWRSTSRLSDETLAIAALLRVDTLPLASIPKERSQERMKSLYLTVGSVPRDIIFFDGPKMVQSPFRWAPATLMARSAINLGVSDENYTASCTPDGLHGLYLALLFDHEVQGGKGRQNFVCVEGEREKDLFLVSWESTYQQNPQQVMYNAVLVREIEIGVHLKPEIDSVVEAIAVHVTGALGDGRPGKSDWGGNVTVIKLSPDDPVAMEALKDPALWSVGSWVQTDFTIC